MKLLTKTISKRFRKIGCQDGLPDEEVIVIAKYFHACGHWTWYATEFNSETNMFFGLVAGDFLEWGYFSLDEFEDLRRKGIFIERDLYFQEATIEELKTEINESYSFGTLK